MFRNPDNFYLILITAIWLIFLLRHTAKDIKQRRELFATKQMLNRIASHKPTQRPIFKWAMIVLAMALMGLAMLRPQGDTYEEEVTGTGLDLVVALDISKSMYANDIDGNSRLEVAKAILSQMVNGLRDDRLGLVVFAGDTMVQCPLSYDKGAFLTFLERANPELLTKQGTNLAGAIQTSLDRFDVTASQSKVIVLVSDGEDSNKERLTTAIKEAARKKIPVFTVGIGSKQGGYIPIGRTWFGEYVYKQHNGKTVITKLDETSLKDIAQETSAKYLRATDISSAKQVIKGLDSIKRVAVTGGTRLTRRELYYFPALLAFLLLLVEWMISERIPYERERDHWLKRI